MSVPSAELTAPSLAPPRRAPARALPQWLTGGRLYLTLGGAALLLAALSLLIPSTPSYDPWSWLLWGREIIHLKLQTTGGPTWKPLPMLFTTVFAVFGKAAPDLWLVIARAGALMCLAMVFKLSIRLTRAVGIELSSGASRGERLSAWAPAVLAGVIATLGLAFSSGFISDNALGYSEGLMTALVLVAVERHLDGHRQQAFAVGFFTALDRPELWLFWGPYGLWLWWKDPGARKLVIGLFALIPVLWFLPEYWGSGHFFRGVSRAHTPRSNSAAFASCPFCTELVHHAWPRVLLRNKALAALAVAAAALMLVRTLRVARRWRAVTAREHALAAIVLVGVLGAGWWILIALMTQAGFSGNDRYLVLGAALIEIAGGVGWGWVALGVGRGAVAAVRRVRRPGAVEGGFNRGPARAAIPARWLGVAVAAVIFVMLTPNFVTSNLKLIHRTHRALVYQALLRSDVGAAIDRLRGPAGVFGCGTVMTEGFQVPMLAYGLGVHILQVEASPLAGEPVPPAPNVIFQARAQRNAHLLPLLSTWRATRYRLATQTRAIRVFEHCRIS